MQVSEKLLDAINRDNKPFFLEKNNYQYLLKTIENAHFVLIGDATHGTHEFYTARAEITKHLILEKGFNAIAIEADWPDTYKIHNFVTNKVANSNPEEALNDFKRFPI